MGIGGAYYLARTVSPTLNLELAAGWGPAERAARATPSRRRRAARGLPFSGRPGPEEVCRSNLRASDQTTRHTEGSRVSGTTAHSRSLAR